MKKALTLAGLVLCVSGVYAAENHPQDQVAEGKRRNEEAYEQMLERTGWKNKKTAKEEKPESERIRDQNSPTSPSKSS